MKKTEFVTKSSCQAVSSAGETCLFVSPHEEKGRFLGDVKHRDPKSAKWAKDKRFRFLNRLPLKMEGSGIPGLTSR